MEEDKEMSEDEKVKQMENTELLHHFRLIMAGSGFNDWAMSICEEVANRLD